MASPDSTQPATPVSLRAKRSASGEHVIITREELANLTMSSHEIASLLRRMTDLEQRFDRLLERFNARPLHGARLEEVALDAGDPRVEP